MWLDSTSHSIVHTFWPGTFCVNKLFIDYVMLLKAKLSDNYDLLCVLISIVIVIARIVLFVFITVTGALMRKTRRS